MRWHVLSFILGISMLFTGIVNLEDVSSSSGSALIRSTLSVEAEIRDHYAVTNVYASFSNPSTSDEEAVFSFAVPAGAMLSNLSLEQDGKVSYASVAKKEDADQRYDDAKGSNKTASKIEGTPSSSLFSAYLNVKGGGSARIGVRFESMLVRTLGTYLYGLDLDSMEGYSEFEEAKGRITIRSTTNITQLVTEGSKLDITEAWTGKGTVALSFYSSNPSIGDNVSLSFKEEKRPGAGVLSTYQDGSGGYFMHLFTPELDTVGTHLPKDIIFVLDRSGSMTGSKIEQLKDAFDSIVHQLYQDDEFNLVIFSSDVSTYKEELVPAYHSNLDSAAEYIRDIDAGGSTNIDSALLTALSKLQYEESSIPIVVFLTDGLPTEGITNTDRIRDDVLSKNDAVGASIYALGFGNDVDFEFLKALALENEGAAVRIPADADAANAMKGFYETISIPLLMDIRFTYGEGTYDVIPDRIPGLYQGSEALIVGRYGTQLETITANVTARDSQGTRYFSDTFNVDPDSDMDMIPRIWAYRTIMDLCDRHIVDPTNESIVQRITELALEYSFVTQYTSFVLVVEEPEKEDGGQTDGPDADSDGVDDMNDAFPNDPSEWADSDGDGVGDNSDTWGITDPTDDYWADSEGKDGSGGGAYGTPMPEMAEPNGLSFIIFLIVICIALLFIVLAVLGFVRIAERNVLDQQNRKRIYDHIIGNPGDHFRSIQRALDLEVGTLSHHINVLEKEQLIVSEQDGVNRLFYPAGMKGRDDRIRLSRVQENILKSIRETPGRTQSEIARDLGVSRKVVYYHVHFLTDSGIVNEEQVGRTPRYYPN